MHSCALDPGKMGPGRFVRRLQFNSLNPYQFVSITSHAAVVSVPLLFVIRVK